MHVFIVQPLQLCKVGCYTTAPIYNFVNLHMQVIRTHEHVVDVDIILLTISLLLKTNFCRL